MQRSSRLQPLIPLSLLTLAVIIIFTPLFDRVVREMSDYIAHIVWTRELLVGNVNIIHVVFHGMVLAVHAPGILDWVDQRADRACLLLFVAGRRRSPSSRGRPTYMWIAAGVLGCGLAFTAQRNTFSRKTMASH